MTLQEVIAKNKERQARAKSLNARVGQTVFQVYSALELAAFFAERLQGASRVEHIKLPENLLLPDLDSQLVEKVLAEAPDRISVLGVDHDVTYYSGQPLINLHPELVNGMKWMELVGLDKLVIPSGKTVSITINFRGHRVSGFVFADIFTKLQREIRSNLWNTFTWGNKPLLLLSDTKPGNTLQIHEHVYGSCPFTGEKFIAYGTMKIKETYCSTGLQFEAGWFFEVDGARLANKLANEKFATLCVESKPVASRVELVEAVKKPTPVSPAKKVSGGGFGSLADAFEQALHR